MRLENYGSEIALREAARDWFATLPSDLEGTARYSALRDVIRESKTSPSTRAMVLMLYKLLGTGELNVSNMHDATMLVAVSSEDLSLVPLIKRDLELMLDHYYAVARNQNHGLLKYIVEIAERGKLTDAA